MTAQTNAAISGFAGIDLGIDFDQLDGQLRDSGMFQYRGESDVSLSPGQERLILEVDGFDFIERGIFQLIEDRLVSITLIINQEIMDHYTLFTRFSSQYGEPASFSPQRIQWESDRNRLTLERPLTVQYLDLVSFSQRLEEGRARESLRDVSRDMFLEQF